MYTNCACLATPPIAEHYRSVAGIESIPRSVAEVRTRELRVEDEEANGPEASPRGVNSVPFAYAYANYACPAIKVSEHICGLSEV